MTETPRRPRTIEELEAEVRVPFERLSYGQAVPPAEEFPGEYDREVVRLLVNAAF
jgi:hypothetical protein